MLRPSQVMTLICLPIISLSADAIAAAPALAAACARRARLPPVACRARVRWFYGRCDAKQIVPLRNLHNCALRCVALL